MKDGWVQQVGEPMEIYSRPANKFVAGFIGSPAMNFIPVTVSEANGAVYVEATGLRTKVPAEKANALKPYKGQTVTLGIRPEDLRVGSGADSPDLSFDATVDVVEPLGSEILLDVAVAGQSVVCRVEPSVKARTRDRIRLAFVPERIHFFEPKTEAVLK
jgi:multiple sugar transport system ATP-binding protein